MLQPAYANETTPSGNPHLLRRRQFVFLPDVLCSEWILIVPVPVILELFVLLPACNAHRTGDSPLASVSLGTTSHFYRRRAPYLPLQ